MGAGKGGEQRGARQEHSLRAKRGTSLPSLPVDATAARRSRTMTAYELSEFRGRVAELRTRLREGEKMTPLEVARTFFGVHPRTAWREIHQLPVLTTQEKIGVERAFDSLENSAQANAAWRELVRHLQKARERKGGIQANLDTNFVAEQLVKSGQRNLSVLTRMHLHPTVRQELLDKLRAYLRAGRQVH